MPSGAILSSAMTGSASEISRSASTVLALLEQEVRDDEVQRRDVGAHADRFEVLLGLAVGLDGSAKWPPSRRRVARPQ